MNMNAVGLYKFLDDQYVDALLNGRIRICTLQYYRMYEVLTGDQFIGDAEEGLTRVTVPPFSIRIGQDMDPEIHQMMWRAGVRINLQEAMTGSFTANAGLHFESRVEGHVFCLSCGPYGAIREEMSKSDGLFLGYNSSIQIMDSAEFLSCLWQGRVSVDGDWYGVDELFESLEGDVVEYGTRSRLFRKGIVIDGDPFVKPERYSSQREYRFFFKHLKRSKLPEIVFVEAEFPNGLLRVVERGDIRPASSATWDEEAAIRSLQQLCAIADEKARSLYGAKSRDRESVRAMSGSDAMRQAERDWWLAEMHEQLKSAYKIFRLRGQFDRTIDRMLLNELRPEKRNYIYSAGTAIALESYIGELINASR